MSSPLFMLIDVRTNKLQSKKKKEGQTPMRKRIAAFALASVMALSLIGCGGANSTSASSAGVSGDFNGTAKGMAAM